MARESLQALGFWWLFKLHEKLQFLHSSCRRHSNPRMATCFGSSKHDPLVLFRCKEPWVTEKHCTGSVENSSCGITRLQNVTRHESTKRNANAPRQNRKPPQGPQSALGPQTLRRWQPGSKSGQSAATLSVEILARLSSRFCSLPRYTTPTRGDGLKN